MLLDLSVLRKEMPMLTHGHLRIRHILAVTVLGGLIAAAPATARHDDRARHEIARLAHGLEVAANEVRRETQYAFRGHRGANGLVERELAELQWQAGRFRHEVERRGPGSHPARIQLEALLQRFYDADRTIRRTPVAGHARGDFERARYFMDTLIAHYGGYRHFRHVQPSGQRGGQGQRWDRDDRRHRAYPRY
jgi:hypothetical protein